VTFLTYEADAQVLFDGQEIADDAAVKLLYLALKNITKDWKMSAREWKSAMNQFAILFADRFFPVYNTQPCFTQKIADRFGKMALRSLPRVVTL
jgi:hypothetical protein